MHAIYAHVHTATPMVHGHRILQAGAIAAGHQHHGVGWHNHGDRHRPVLGDRARVGTKRTPHRVRVYSHRVAVGYLNHISRGLLSGKHILHDAITVSRL